MAPKGSRTGKGNATARAKIPELVMNLCMSLNRDRKKGFIWQHIPVLKRLYNACGVKDERAWDLFYDINLLDPFTTRYFSQFQLIWLHPSRTSSPFRKWWAASISDLG